MVMVELIVELVALAFVVIPKPVEKPNAPPAVEVTLPPTRVMLVKRPVLPLAAKFKVPPLITT
jgi:hypothetical protein